MQKALEAQLREAQARLDAARAGDSAFVWSAGDPVMRGWRERDASPSQSATADARWAAMCAEADAMVASGKSVSAEFILEAGRRARGDEPARVVPLRPSYFTPEQLAHFGRNRGNPK
jgi:hypothetical protein